VWWQKCTRPGPVDRIRASESRRVAGLTVRQVLVGRPQVLAGRVRGVPVEQLKPGIHEAEPVIELRRLALGAVQLRSLDIAGGVREDDRLPASWPARWRRAGTQ
jgi:hypothetical protein